MPTAATLALTFNDVIGNGIFHLDEFGWGDLLEAAIALIAALLMGFLIHFVYERTYKGVLYNPSFNMMLVLMTVLTAMIIVTISSNIVLSLGMVGALSIIRYRTAIKDPLDLMYIFWAVATGITVGAGLYLVALMGALVVIACLLFNRRSTGKEQVYVLLVHCLDPRLEDEIVRAIGRHPYEVKSKVMRRQDVEIAVEVRTRAGNLAFAERVRALEGVNDVSVIAYNGIYNG